MNRRWRRDDEEEASDVQQDVGVPVEEGGSPLAEEEVVEG